MPRPVTRIAYSLLVATLLLSGGVTLAQDTQPFFRYYLPDDPWAGLPQSIENAVYLEAIDLLEVEDTLFLYCATDGYNASRSDFVVLKLDQYGNLIDSKYSEVDSARLHNYTFQLTNYSHLNNQLFNTPEGFLYHIDARRQDFGSSFNQGMISIQKLRGSDLSFVPKAWFLNHQQPDDLELGAVFSDSASTSIYIAGITRRGVDASFIAKFETGVDTLAWSHFIDTTAASLHTIGCIQPGTDHLIVCAKNNTIYERYHQVHILNADGEPIVSHRLDGISGTINQLFCPHPDTLYLIETAHQDSLKTNIISLNPNTGEIRWANQYQFINSSFYSIYYQSAFAIGEDGALAMMHSHDYHAQNYSETNLARLHPDDGRVIDAFKILNPVYYYFNHLKAANDHGYWLTGLYFPDFNQQSSLLNVPGASILLLDKELSLPCGFEREPRIIEINPLNVSVTDANYTKKGELTLGLHDLKLGNRQLVHENQICIDDNWLNLSRIDCAEDSTRFAVELVGEGHNIDWQLPPNVQLLSGQGEHVLEVRIANGESAFIDLTYDDANHNPQSLSELLVAKDIITVDISLAEDMGCEHIPIEVQAETNFMLEQPPVSFIWQDSLWGSTTTLSPSDTFRATNAGPNRIILEVRDAYNCSARDTLHLTPPLREIPPSGITDTSICPRTEATLAIDSRLLAFPDVEVQWWDGSSAPSRVLSDTGRYALTLSSSCDVRTDTVEIRYVPPIADLPQQTPTTFCPK
ncbi:MAG: hypothetical protein ACOCZ8_00800, partial [Bacteroidota bacterium]